MKTEEIAALNVKDISDENCVLFMWATFPKLFDAEKVINSWGFEYKTCAFVWVKTNKNTDVNQTSFLPADSFDTFWGGGHYTRSNAEVCLLATKGKPKRLSASVHQIIYAPVREHSRKPEEAYCKIEKLYGKLPRVELFARKLKSGWDSWGNEISKKESGKVVLYGF